MRTPSSPRQSAFGANLAVLTCSSTTRPSRIRDGCRACPSRSSLSILANKMRNVREPLGLVNREVSDVLNLCLPSYGHCKRSLCQLVGHIADQQEELVDTVQCRADRVGVKQVAASHLCPVAVGQLRFLVPSQDADRLSTAKQRLDYFCAHFARPAR